MPDAPAETRQYKDDIVIRNCNGCGKRLELVRGYVKYFKQYQRMTTPRPELLCPDCGTVIYIQNIPVEEK